MFSSSCKITSRLLRKVEVWRAWADFSTVRFWIKIEVLVLGLVLKVVVGVLYRRWFIEKKGFIYKPDFFYLELWPILGLCSLDSDTKKIMIIVIIVSTVADLIQKKI